MDKKPTQQNGKTRSVRPSSGNPAGRYDAKKPGTRPGPSKTGSPAGKWSGQPGGAGGRPAGKYEEQKRESYPPRPVKEKVSVPRPTSERPGASRLVHGRPGVPRPMNGRSAPGQRPADAALPSMTSRRLALEIFEDVVRKDAYAALSLDDRLKNANLSQLDKRFCASLVYRTLENLIRIDYALSFFLKDADALEPRVRDILRISACQLLFHDRVPENAVVDEAVKLTRALGLEGLTGLTNAVLRGMARGKDEIKWPSPEEGARYLSILYSVPQWLAERLMEAYGPEMAREICAYRSAAHFTTIRPNMARLTDEAFGKLLEKKVWEVEKSAVPHAFRVRMASEIARDADYLAGNFSIQGESSMLAAQAMAVRGGMQVLDCCAAPGGKTAYLAEIMGGAGRVYAWDVHDHRVALIRAMMKRLRLENIRPAVRDASVLKEDSTGAMDAVLLDAPCSGLGVMDNKPDIKYRVTAQSVKELTELQEKLLDTCCQYVKIGGTLVYSTCSILPEENGEQVGRFLRKHSEFEIAPLPEDFPAALRERYGQTGLQLLPCRDGVEGFFIARLRRVK